MRAPVVMGVAAFLAACGRYGFGDHADAEALHNVAKPDGAADVDAGAAPPDSPAGVGTYTTMRSTAPYTLLAGTLVPGVAVGDDDENFPLALPFTFTFFGVAYTSVTVSVNGYVTFGPPVMGTESSSNECPFDMTAPDAVIAVFWDDLYVSTYMPTGTITYLVDGTAPDRRVTIEWRDMDAFYASGPNAFTQGVRITQAVVLHEAGTIEMHYGPRTPSSSNPNKDCGSDRDRGCSATIGLEAPASTSFVPVSCGTSAGPGQGWIPVDEGTLITFVPS